MKIIQIVIRITTLALLVAFPLSSVGVLPQAVALPAAPLLLSPISGTFQISGDIARVGARFEGDKDSFVFLIQDAHGNIEAQRKISEILNKLIASYGIKTLYAEGVEGRFDEISLYQSYPHTEITREVFDQLLKDGRISGAEFTAVTSAHNISVFGADKEKAYLDNVRTYVETYPDRMRHIRATGDAQEAAGFLKDSILSAPVKAIISASGQFKEGKIDLMSYLDALCSAADDATISLKDLPVVAADSPLGKVLSARKKLRTFLQKELEEERVRIIHTLVSSDMSAEAGEELARLERNYRQGEIKVSAYYASLTSIMERSGLDLDAFPHTQTYKEEISVFDDLAAGEFMDDLRAFEEELIERGSTPEEREILEIERFVRLLSALYSYTLTEEEYAELKVLKLNGDKLEKFFRKYDTGLMRDDLTFADGFKRYFSFYETAADRNEILAKNVLKTMKKRSEKVSVLITGGFHTNGISEYLRKKDISHVTLMPVFNGVNENQAYTEKMISYAEDFGLNGVIPAKAGIHKLVARSGAHVDMDSRFRGNDDNKMARIPADTAHHTVALFTEIQKFSSPINHARVDLLKEDVLRKFTRLLDPKDITLWNHYAKDHVFIQGIGGMLHVLTLDEFTRPLKDSLKSVDTWAEQITARNIGLSYSLAEGFQIGARSPVAPFKDKAEYVNYLNRAYELGQRNFVVGKSDERDALAAEQVYSRFVALLEFAETHPDIKILFIVNSKFPLDRRPARGGSSFQRSIQRQLAIFKTLASGKMITKDVLKRIEFGYEPHFSNETEALAIQGWAIHAGTGLAEIRTYLSREFGDSAVASIPMVYVGSVEDAEKVWYYFERSDVDGIYFTNGGELSDEDLRSIAKEAEKWSDKKKGERVYLYYDDRDIFFEPMDYWVRAPAALSADPKKVTTIIVPDNQKLPELQAAIQRGNPEGSFKTLLGANPIHVQDIEDTVATMALHAASQFPQDYLDALEWAYDLETSELGRQVITRLIRNAIDAGLNCRPTCQDTGQVVVFVDKGREAAFVGGNMYEAINQGVRRAYSNTENPLRKSIVFDPLFDRRNTGDNTPAVIHFREVEGRNVTIHLGEKGYGSENKSFVEMLQPSDTIDDIVRKVLEHIKKIGGDWCPPGCISLGIGGNLERSAIIAKRAILDQPYDMHKLYPQKKALQKQAGSLQPVRLRLEAKVKRSEELAPDEKAKLNRVIAELKPVENKLLRIRLFEEINSLGIGPGGLGGRMAVLDVKLTIEATHIAGKPVALNCQCNKSHHTEAHLNGSGPQLEFPKPGYDGLAVRQVVREAEKPQRPPIHLTLPKPGNEIQIAEFMEKIKTLRAGDFLLLKGKILTARDAAHARMEAALNAGEPLPVPLKGRFIYYVGPVDPAQGEVIGSAGPTTASRMNKYAPRLLRTQGLAGNIGKAEMGPDVVKAHMETGTIFMHAIGGAAYLQKDAIKGVRVLAWPDLGTEALREFDVENFPVIVSIDSVGGDLFDPTKRKGEPFSLPVLQQPKMSKAGFGVAESRKFADEEVLGRAISEKNNDGLVSALRSLAGENAFADRAASSSYGLFDRAFGGPSGLKKVAEAAFRTIQAELHQIISPADLVRQDLALVVSDKNSLRLLLENLKIHSMRDEIKQTLKAIILLFEPSEATTRDMGDLLTRHQLADQVKVHTNFSAGFLGELLPQYTVYLLGSDIPPVYRDALSPYVDLTRSAELVSLLTQAAVINEIISSAA